MENTTSYSISEAADLLNLSAKTIRRYIKAGKLPSVMVSTKFGEEYRITEIPEALKEEAAAQAAAQAKVEVVSKEEPFKLDAQQLYQDNIRLALQLGAANGRIRDLEERIRLLEAPKAPPVLTEPQPQPVKLPWWKRILGGK
jgi:MerR family transcriptional regulator, copper efflux regulator